MDLDFDAFQPDDSVSPIPQVLALTKLPVSKNVFSDESPRMQRDGLSPWF